MGQVGDTQGIILIEGQRAIANLGQKVAQSEKPTDDFTNRDAGIIVYLNRVGMDDIETRKRHLLEG